MATICVLIFQLRHKHQLSEARVYHIYNDRVYYTRQCVKDKHIQSFETDKTFADVVESLSNDDQIVMEEDFEVPGIFEIATTPNQSEGLEDNVIININLNNKKICSMFELNIDGGNVKFNISNGVVDSTCINAIKVSGQNGNVELNITNVECYSVGDKNASLYIEGSNQVLVNANNSKFISKNTSSSYHNYGVGVFINNEGEFLFNNCTLEGGDGLHVRQGNISLTDCSLINTGLIAQDYQSLCSGFYAVGASLVAHCYTENAQTTAFKITVDNCVMITNNSNRVIYVYKVASLGDEAVMNSNSYIEIISCKFDENPNAFYNQDKVIYRNGTNLVNNDEGYWISGDFSE